MRYINPFDLLEITPEKLSDANGATINKAKRKLFAEIELSDSSTIVYEGIEISKGDCLKVIDELDNRDKKEFHFFIYQHKYLNQFLAKGKLNFFENYQAESIYKLPEFLDFISQFFAEQYDKLLLENYKRWNQESVAKILSVKPITNEAYYEKCYKSTYAYIKEIDTEINEIINDISNNKSPFIDKKFNGLDKVIINKVNISLLNLLPSYFQNLRNQLALSIRNLARDINNDPFNLYEPAFKIIEIAYSLSIDALTKQTITKGYYTIKKNYEDDLTKLQVQKELDTEDQIIASWRKRMNHIEIIEKEIEEGESKYISSNFFSLDKEIYEIADPTKLNSLSDNFQDIRNQVANTIRSLSVTVNNEPHQKHKVAYDIISIAYSIKSNGSVAEKVSIAYETIKKNFDKQVVQTFKANDKSFAKEEAEEKEEKKSKSDLFGISLIVCMALGFFYRPMQYFILGIQLLILLMTLRYSFKKLKSEKLNFGAFIKNSALFIIGAIVGFFNIFIARTFVAFYFFLFSYEYISDFIPKVKSMNFNKGRGTTILFLIFSLAASYIYAFAFEKDSANSKNNTFQESLPIKNSNSALPSFSFTENDSSESTTGEIKFGNSSVNNKVKIDSITFINLKIKQNQMKKPVKKSQEINSQKTGEIKF